MDFSSRVQDGLHAIRAVRVRVRVVQVVMR